MDELTLADGTERIEVDPQDWSSDKAVVSSVETDETRTRQLSFSFGLAGQRGIDNVSVSLDSVVDVIFPSGELDEELLGIGSSAREEEMGVRGVSSGAFSEDLLVEESAGSSLGLSLTLERVDGILLVEVPGPICAPPPPFSSPPPTAAAAAPRWRA